MNLGFNKLVSSEINQLFVNITKLHCKSDIKQHTGGSKNLISQNRYSKIVFFFSV